MITVLRLKGTPLIIGDTHNISSFPLCVVTSFRLSYGLGFENLLHNLTFAKPIVVLSIIRGALKQFPNSF